MRRISLWFASTVSVVALLFGYHTSTSGPDPTAGAQAAVSGSLSGHSDQSAGTARAGQRSTGAGSGSGGNSGSGGGSGSTSSTVTGSVAQTQWGPVQVQLTVAGGSITDVSVVQYPSGNSQDDQINSYALPQLIQETLNAQSSSIDMVSGATVTSTGYLQSLQSAIDQAGL